MINSMINSFEINSFKRYKNIDFKDLNRINIFLGSNNAGKSTILEAIFGFISGKNMLPIIYNVITRRNGGNLNSVYDFMERFLGVLHNQNTKPFTFSFKGTLLDNSTYNFEHSLDPYGIFADFKPTLMGSFGNNRIENKSNLMGQLNQLIPSIQGNIQVNVTPIGKWKVRETRNGKSKSKEFELAFPPISNNLHNDPLLLGRFVDILTHRDQQENTKIYSFLKRERVMEEFVIELQKTFPEILNIDSIPYPDGSPAPVSFKTKDNQLLPMYNFGDGVQRWYNILGGMILYQNSVHCIEEIDATFHPSAQGDLARNLYKYSKKYNNQLFMTSHSIEFVDNLLQAIYEDDTIDEDIVRVITLKNDPNTDEIRTRVMTGKEAYESREKYQLELR